MTIAENIEEIRNTVNAVSGGRKVYLVAATKMNPAESVREAIAAGVDACGENRAQEFLEKDALGAYEGAEKHFIGHLQRNKVNKIVGRVDLIQSIDSEALLELTNKAASMLGIVQDILIEISIAKEVQKSGADTAALPSLLEYASRCPNVRVRGLMCIPPIQMEPHGNRPYFAAMRKLFIDNSEKIYDNIQMEFLSMGMTDDYADAVAEGANMIRVGSGIFGERHY